MKEMAQSINDFATVTLIAKLKPSTLTAEK